MGCVLSVRQWAAVRQGASGDEALGDAGGEDIIPSGFRRRMGKLERVAVRCMLGILASGTSSELIFCSRYGNVETLAVLLRSIIAEEPVSPMAFSGSVHNAAPGMVGQIRKERLSHTALAAGPDTLRAGLVEAYARLCVDGCNDVIVAYTDLPLADFFGELGQDGTIGVGLSLRLSLDKTDGEAAMVTPGRGGVLSVIEQLGQGSRILAVGDGPWTASA